MTTLFLSRLVYVLIWCLACVVAALSELDVIPVAYVHQTPAEQYAFQLIGLVLAVGCMYVCLRWERFSFIRLRMAASYYRWELLRVIVIALPVLFNLWAYYATLNTQLVFCFLISLVASIFCWPKEKPTA